MIRSLRSREGSHPSQWQSRQGAWVLTASLLGRKDSEPGNCSLTLSSFESVALTQEELTIGPKVRAGPNGPALTFRAEKDGR